MESYTIHTNPCAPSTSIPPPKLAVVGPKWSLESLWGRGSLDKDEVRNKNTGTAQNTKKPFPGAERLTWQDILAGNRNHKSRDTGPRRKQIQISRSMKLFH